MLPLAALKALAHTRLSAALDEVFLSLEQTFSEYQEEIQRQRRLLDLLTRDSQPPTRPHTLTQAAPEHLQASVGDPWSSFCVSVKTEEPRTDTPQDPAQNQNPVQTPIQIRVHTAAEVQDLVQIQEQDGACKEENTQPCDTTKLIKTKLKNKLKYVRIRELSLTEFLNAAFRRFGVPPVTDVCVLDETGTEVDSDVFSEFVQRPHVGVLTLRLGADDCGVGVPSSSLMESSREPNPDPGLDAGPDPGLDPGPDPDLDPGLDPSLDPGPDPGPDPGLDPGLDPSPDPGLDPSPDDTVVLNLVSCGPSHMMMDRPFRPRQHDADEAKQVVESALNKKLGGERIFSEYLRTRTLTDSSRRLMVNILAADMTEIHGTKPPRGVRETYAKGIVSLFPSLTDPLSKHGYEHFFDGESGTGYLAWRLKTIQRRFSSRAPVSPHQPSEGGPSARRDPALVLAGLTRGQCEEAVAFMKTCSDHSSVQKKMRETFGFRRDLILDQTRTRHVFMEFPRFTNVTGLIEQDFVMLFGEDVSHRFLQRWPSVFKQKVIEQCRRLPGSSDLEELLLCASSQAHGDDVTVNSGWDSDLSSLVLLLHLIPPSAQGRKRPGRLSAAQAQKLLLVFVKSGSDLQAQVEVIGELPQPYLLAVGSQRSRIQWFFIVLHKRLVPCRSSESLSAFDELFKAHFVFGTKYNRSVHNIFTFLQTTVYNIDVGKVHESPRVAEVRARLLR